MKTILLSLAILTLPSLANAQDVVFAPDTIKAKPMLCRPDPDGGRTCETARGWAARQLAVIRTQGTVGPTGWR